VKFPLQPHDYRCLRRRDGHLPKQHLGFGVGLQVHEAIGNGVPLGEVAQPMSVRGETGADDLDALEAVGPDQLATLDEGLDNGVA